MCGDATRQEIDRLKRENSELKELVGELSLEFHRFKNISATPTRQRHRRMSAVEQSRVVAEVERHGRGKSRRLRELGISRSTYYWWRWRHRQGSWEGTEEIDRPWNRLRPDEAAVVLAAAREMPTWRSRQLAAYPPTTWT